MPNNQIAAIHPRFGDPFPLMSDKWAETVEQAVAATNYSVIEVFGPDASRTQPKIQQVSGVDVVLIMGLGHGTDDAFFAFGNAEQLYGPITLPQASEVKNKIVHLCACSTAVTLGGKFVSAGCAAFIGYTGLITFGTDLVNKSIAFADAQIDLALAAKQNVKQAVEAAQTVYAKVGMANIGQMLTILGSADVALPPQDAAPATATNTISSHKIAPSNTIATNQI